MRPCSYTISMEHNGIVCIDIAADDTETGHEAAAALVTTLAQQAERLHRGDVYRVSLVR